MLLYPPPMQWVVEAFCPGVMRQKQQTCHLPTPQAKVDEWSFTTAPLCLHGVHGQLYTLYMYLLSYCQLAYIYIYIYGV